MLSKPRAIPLPNHLKMTSYLILLQMYIYPPIKNHFSSYSSQPRTIYGAGQSPVRAVGYGNVDIRLKNGRVLRLNHVLHIPRGPNLISLAKLEQSGFLVKWSKPPFPIEVLDSDDETVMKFDQIGTQYLASLLLSSIGNSERDKVRSHMDSQQSVEREWHLRIGHINNKYANTAVTDSGVDTKIRTFECLPCKLAKSTLTPSSREHNTATDFLGRIHLDLGGGRTSLPPGKPIHHYHNKPTTFLLITDDFTNYRWFYPLIRNQMLLPESLISSPCAKSSFKEYLVCVALIAELNLIMATSRHC